MLRQVIRTGAACAAAVLLAFCYPSGTQWWLAWIAPVLLILSVDEDALRPAFLRGYAAGFLFFMAALFWIHHVTLAGLVLLALYLALYWAIFGAAAAWSSRWGIARRIVFLASVWTALEYIRAEAFTGFGWAALAHTQSANVLLIQIADITGTYGVSFVMMAAAVLVAAWVRSVHRRESLPWGFAPAAWGVVLLLVLVLLYGAGRLNSAFPAGTKRVALIQANVSLAEHADPGLKPGVVAKHLALSREALRAHPELIVWPETSFPQFIWEYPALFEEIRDLARENRVPVLVGAVTRTGEEYFNSALLIDGSGQLVHAYDKQHLVLFGEYIPLRAQLPFLERLVPIDDFTPGKWNVVFPLPGGAAFSALICFEDTLPGIVRRAAAERIGFLVNITNDAWFGASRQPRMHLDNAVFRAVESRLSLVRATNTGMSCAILPTGQVTACVSAADGRQTLVDGLVVADVPVRPADEGVTVYTKYGDIFAMLCFIGILGMSIPFMRKPEA